MSPAAFAELAAFLKAGSGLSLAADKLYLAESRLMPIARRLGLDGLEALMARLRLRQDPALAAEVLEAMTINETLFFRDGTPFELMRREVLPRLCRARPRGRPLRIWCAAASLGQEPYSVAMLLREEVLLLAGRMVEIVGTDLSMSYIERARRGVYHRHEVARGLPEPYLRRYFESCEEGWRIDDRIRSMVRFRQVNLIEDFSHLGTFDVIFCRNVLLYFDEATKRDVLDRLARTLAPDGVLFLGAAETVVGVTRAFEPCPGQRGAYRPVTIEKVDPAF